jgi:hypothetical protein
MQLRRKNKLKNLENGLIMKNNAINTTNIQQEKSPKKPKTVKNKKAQRKNRRAFFVK